MYPNRSFRRLPAFIALAALLAACPAAAQDGGEGASEKAQAPPDMTRTLLSHPWELSSADRSKTCIVSFKTASTAKGQVLEKDAGCTALAFMKDVVAWRVRGLDLLTLIDSQGEAVIDLSEVENSIFEGRRPGEGIFILQNVEEAKEAARSMDLLVGNWALARPQGASVCRLTLTNTPADGDNFQVFTKAPCDAPVSTFAPSTWRLERGAILLNSASGNVWRFEADDLAQWRRVPEDVDPLMLQRQ